MTATKTPGETAYEAFWQAFAAIYGADIDTWETTHPGTQRCWEAAAQAVLDQAKATRPQPRQVGQPWQLGQEQQR